MHDLPGGVPPLQAPVRLTGFGQRKLVADDRTDCMIAEEGDKLSGPLAVVLEHSALRRAFAPVAPGGGA